jgi:hypothetical protein
MIPTCQLVNHVPYILLLAIALLLEHSPVLLGHIVHAFFVVAKTSCKPVPYITNANLKSVPVIVHHRVYLLHQHSLFLMSTRIGTVADPGSFYP